MSTLEAGTIVAEKLQIVRLLGAGGMGAVYEVEHRFTKHRRALKLLHRETLNKNTVERFLREASAAGRIGNKHIVETFDAGHLESGEPYLVMEMLQGKSLADILKERGPLVSAEAIDIIIQACDGLQAAHDAGIIHRDLKPDNLFIQNDGLVKLLDFGISKFEDRLTEEKPMTVEGTIMGTPYYMSPEQLRGVSNLDGRSDIYSLGVVLYECLTNSRPYSADTLAYLAILISEGNFEPPSRRAVHLDTSFDFIIAKAMHRDRELRFSSAREMASALQALRNDTPATETSGPAKQLTPTSVLEETLASEQAGAGKFAQPSPTLSQAAGRSSSDTTQGSPLHGSHSKSSVFFMVLVAVGLSAAGLWFLSRKAPTHVTMIPDTLTAPQHSEAPASPQAPISSTVATSVALASAPSSQSPPPSPSGKPSPSPSGVAVPKGTTRADKFKMAKENPF